MNVFEMIIFFRTEEVKCEDTQKKSSKQKITIIDRITEHNKNIIKYFGNLMSQLDMLEISQEESRMEPLTRSFC